MRDFIYVRDLTKIIKNICEKKIYGTYNIASGSSCNVKKIIKKLRMKKSDFTDIKIAIKETFIWYKKNFKLN
jgi:dTDP-D-glucose 4,6-dehydratase